MSKIALVVLDTLRKDSFDKYFDWLPGSRFSNAYATSHWTVPSHASLFTGKLASEVGTYARSTALDTENPVLAEKLTEMGYETYAFSTNGHISPGFQFDRGFDVFRQNWRSKRLETDRFPWMEYISESGYPLPVGILQAIVACVRSDYETVSSIKQPIQYLRRKYQIGDKFTDSGARSALSFVQSREFPEDSFLYLNLMETHAPLLPPPTFRTTDYPEGGYSYTTTSKYPITSGESSAVDRDSVRTAYDDASRYLSYIYERIFEQIDDFDCVITLSDHGELLGENEMFGHSYGVAPELTHVPLVITTPDQQPSTVDRVVSLADVYGTILEMAGDTTVTSSSQHLLQDESSTPKYTEYHGITYTERIETLRELGVEDARIRSLDEPLYGVATQRGCYGYETNEGYTERGTCSSSDPEGLISEHAEKSPAIVKEGTEIDESVKDRLSDLGYV
jgi:arylsulfatase A-like enzyme